MSTEYLKQRRFKHKVTLLVEFVNSRVRDILLQTLSIEANEHLTVRGRVFVKPLHEKSIMIVVEAQDLSMLRALVNSFIRLLDVAYKSLLVLESLNAPNPNENFPKRPH